VVLDDGLRRDLDHIYDRIAAIAEAHVPPCLVRCTYCRSCAYAEWCWS
jgi:CRISPR-associated exonuclease Cas4